jgi:hypothetical protein
MRSLRMRISVIICPPTGRMHFQLHPLRSAADQSPLAAGKLISNFMNKSTRRLPFCVCNMPFQLCSRLQSNNICAGSTRCRFSAAFVLSGMTVNWFGRWFIQSICHPIQNLNDHCEDCFHYQWNLALSTIIKAQIFWWAFTHWNENGIDRLQNSFQALLKTMASLMSSIAEIHFACCGLKMCASFL